MLVTGGTGVLGRELVTRLKEAGYTVRVMSRRPASSNPWPDVEWAQADVASGKGLEEAVAGVEVVVHAATDSAFTPQGVRVGHLLFPDSQVDVDGTRRVLEQAKKAKVSHIIYPSIVGIDRIPLTYYQHKLHAEEIIVNSGLPWTIQRATQFHDLTYGLLQFQARWPFLLLPTDFLFQPIDSAEFAERLREIVVAGPSGRLPDIGGPEVLSLRQLAEVWLKTRGLRRWTFHLPTWGKVAEGFRRGYLTCPQEKYGKVTWGEWVHKRFASGGESR